MREVLPKSTLELLLPSAPEIVDEMAETVFVLSWASCEEEEGRTYPGQELTEVAPLEKTPERFKLWAWWALSRAAQIAYRDSREILEEWREISSDLLGPGLALTMAGWTDGLGERGISAPAERLPILGEHELIRLSPEDYQ